MYQKEGVCFYVDYRIHKIIENFLKSMEFDFASLASLLYLWTKLPYNLSSPAPVGRLVGLSIGCWSVLI